MVHNYDLIAGKSTRILLVIERNYGNGQFATFLREEIERKQREDKESVIDHHGTRFIDVYKEPEYRAHGRSDTGGKSSGGKQRDYTRTATGFMTDNGSKAYGVFRIRQRLEYGKTHIAFPLEPIITTTPSLNDAAIRYDTQDELSRFECHPPSLKAKRRLTLYHGKRRGKTDDKVMCFMIADAVYCYDCNEAELEFREELYDCQKT